MAREKASEATPSSTAMPAHDPFCFSDVWWALNAAAR
jgi:hypothetical protein